MRDTVNAGWLAGLFFLSAGLVLNSGQAWADSWQHTGSLRVSTEFDTNPALSSTYPGSVRRAMFEPSYTAMGRVGESELKAGLALQIARSSNQSLSQNLDSPSAFFDWSHQSEINEFGISTKYAEIATRDAGVDGTGQVPLDSTRASRALSGRWNRSLSERTILSADGAYETITYSGGSFTDYSTQSGGLKVSYALSETGTSFFRLSGNKYVPNDGGPSSNLATVSLGFGRKVEHMDLNMQLGKSRRSGGNSDLQGAVAMTYTGERTQLTLNADRTITTSGLGDFVKVDQLKGGWSYALSERSNIGVDLQGLKNYSVTINNIRTMAGIWLQHELNPSWQVRTYYQHNILRGSGVSSASSNIVGISLSYAYSNF